MKLEITTAMLVSLNRDLLDLESRFTDLLGKAPHPSLRVALEAGFAAAVTSRNGCSRMIEALQLGMAKEDSAEVEDVLENYADTVRSQLRELEAMLFTLGQDQGHTGK